MTRRVAAAALTLAAAAGAWSVAAGARQDESTPDSRRAVARAMGLLAGGEAHEARRALEEYVRSNPGDGPAWFALGECRRDLLDYAGAVAAVRRAHELEPRSAEYALALGNLHFVRLEKDLALASYEAALRVEPENPHAAANRRTILAERERLDALRRRRRALWIALSIEAAAITAGVLVVCRSGRPLGSGLSVRGRL
jgi:cytochrome c-type biogenesis protein CcmH/NrfG